MRFLSGGLEGKNALELYRRRKNELQWARMKIRTLGGWYFDGIPVHQDDGCFAEPVAIEECTIC